MRAALVALLLCPAVSSCAPWYRDDELRALSAHDYERLSSLVSEGEEHLAAGRPEQAQRRFEEAAELNPHHPPALDGLARSLAARGRHEAALAVATFAVAVAPDAAAPARAMLVQSFAKQGLYALALDHSSSDDVSAVVSHLPLTATYGKLAEAHALAKEGKGPEALERYAEWLADYGVPDHEKLRRWSDAILELAAPLSTRLMQQASDHAAEGKVVEATIGYGLAFRYTPSTKVDVLARQKLVDVASRLPDVAALSLVASEQAAAGDEALRQGREGEAMLGYRRAVAAAPYWPELRHNLALLFAGVSMYGEAVRQMEWFLQLAPGSERAAAAQELVQRWKAKGDAAP